MLKYFGISYYILTLHISNAILMVQLSQVLRDLSISGICEFLTCMDDKNKSSAVCLYRRLESRRDNSKVFLFFGQNLVFVVDKKTINVEYVYSIFNLCAHKPRNETTNY